MRGHRGWGRRTGLAPPFSDAALGDAARSAQAAVGGLPLPVHAPQVVALGQQDGPQDVEDAPVFPAAEGAVDAAVVAELGGQVVPLAAGPHPEDDAVEGPARVAALPAGSGGRVVDGQDLLDQRPERVGDVPDRRQRLGPLLGVRFGGWFHALIIGRLWAKVQPPF